MHYYYAFVPSTFDRYDSYLQLLGIPSYFELEASLNHSIIAFSMLHIIIILLLLRNRKNPLLVQRQLAGEKCLAEFMNFFSKQSSIDSKTQGFLIGPPKKKSYLHILDFSQTIICRCSYLLSNSHAIKNLLS